MYKKAVTITGVNTNNIKVLTHEEMIILFNRYKTGDMLAKEELINGNLKLVLSILKKYNTINENMDDLFQIGVVGLIKAVDSFDIERNVRFATYAAKCIDNEILMLFRQDKKKEREVSLNEPIGKDKEGNEISLKDIIGEDSGRKQPDAEEGACTKRDRDTKIQVWAFWCKRMYTE